MSKSVQLRAQDWRAILGLVGECREMGDEQVAWRTHLLGRLAAMAGIDVGFCVEMGGHRARRPVDLGYVDWGFENGFDRAVQAEVYERVDRDRSLHDPMMRYFRRLAEEDGACCSRTDIIGDREWYGCGGYQLVHRPLELDHILWCFRSIPDPRGDALSGLLLYRAEGRRDFTARERSIVCEVHGALGSLVGGSLARFADPSPMDLSPRVRQVLACLLEGDGDKQVAARLGLALHTVNEYTKGIFRHFGVRSRPELLARWVRRGWHAPPSWVDRGAVTSPAAHAQRP